MANFAANLGFLFRDLPWRDRFAAASAAGFDAVEFAWPAIAPAEIAAAVRDSGLGVVLMNMAAGNLDAGDRGHPNDPRRRDEWRADFDAALDVAVGTRCPTVNVLAGNVVPDVPFDSQVLCLHDNLAWAPPRARRVGVRIVVELLNPADNPRYLVTSVSAAVELLDAFGADGPGLQFDTYHVAQVVPDVVVAFRELAARVAHVQIADAPGRHEPGTGAIDWAAFFRALREASYDGAVGLEYVPTRPVAGTLAELRVAAGAP